MDASDGQDDYKKLPVLERLQHKLWKARMSAYEELAKLFARTENDSDFYTYEEFLKKMVTDANAAAQEAGVQAVVEFVTNAPNPVNSRDAVVPSLVEKCLSATKAGTKQKATDLILLYAEVDTANPVVELVIPGISAKQPKLVSQTVVVLRELVRQFGTKTVGPKPILKILPKLFGHADKNVRAETSTLTIELYHWIGAALNPHLSELKPVQVKELEEAFAKLPATKPVPQRLLRSEQAAAAAAAETPEVDMEEANENQEDEPMEEQAIDAYDLADPVDITAKLPSNLYELLVSKKWTERQSGLDEILKASKVPKIMDKDYSELIGALAKRINDAHILLVGAAANCIEAIANGSRQDFAKYKAAVVPPMVEKLKERKPAVLEQVANGLNAVFATVPLADIVDDVSTGAKHKNPQVRSESVKLVTRRLREIRDAPSSGDIKTLAALMLKTSEDADANTREASLEGLGTLMKVTGEKAMISYTEKLDDIKRSKVKEAFDKAEVKVKVTAPKKPAPPPTSAPKVAKKAPVRKAPAAKERSPMVIDDEPAPEAPEASATPKRKPPSRPAGGSLKKPALASSKPKAAPASAPKKAAKLPPSSGPEEVRYKFSAEDAEARATEFIPEEIWNSVAESQWKVRLAAMESLHTHFESQDLAGIEPEIVLRCLSKKPGWKETNFQVMGKLFAVMQLIASKCSNFTKSCGAIGIPGLVEKLGDIKLKKPATECLAMFAEKTSLQFVFSLAYPVLKKAKSPKVLADSLTWIHASLMEFGIAGLQVRDLIDFLKYALSNTNPAVRSNAVVALGALRLYIGPEVRTFVQDVSPGLLSAIDTEFEKVAAMEPPQPTKATTMASSGGDALDALLPRVDISSSLGKLAASCNDSNWKTRKEGLDKTMAVIEDASKRIKPNLGDFPSVLKQRLNDSNKNLQIQAAEITGLLAASMGKPFEKYAKVLTAPVTAILGDNKANVRAAGVATLEQFRQTCGLDMFISTFATSLAADSPMLRKDLLVWLGSCLKDDEPCDLSPLVTPLFSCLQDRNADVRKAAQAVLPAVVASAGYESVVQRTADLKGSQRQTVLPMIEALRGSVPESVNNKPSSLGAAVMDARPADAATAKATPPASRIKALGGKKLGSPAARAGSSGGASASPSLAAAAAVAPPPPEQAQPPILTSDPRAKQIRAKKENRWQFDTPRPDLIDGLRSLCEPHFSSAVCSLMFSTHQYAERDRLSALGLLDECIANPDVSMAKYNVDFADMKQRYVANADILLKYLTIRFFDTNTSMLIKCLDMTQHLVAVMDEEGYHLSEYEAFSFLPFLISKVGDPKEIMRTRVREILKSVCRIYPGSKLFNYLIECAANSKNAKTRAECLEETGALIQRNGISVMLPNKSLPLIAGHIGDRDAGVRNAALSAIAQAYILIGDTVYKYVTRLGEKEKGMLEERLKRTKPSPSVLAEREAKAQQEAEAMEVDEIPTISHLPRHARPPAGKQRMVPPTSMQRYSTQSAPSDPMDDASYEQGRRMQEPARRSVPAPSSMRQPRSMQAMAQSALPTDPREYNEDYVDYLIAQIMSGDPHPSIEALKQLDKLLGTHPDLVSKDLERLINAITLQVRLSYSSVNPGEPVTTRLCKHLVNALVLLFSNPDLATSVSRDALHHLLQELAHRLLDREMLSMESGPQLSKALNVAMVKVLENSQGNVTFSALLSILSNCSRALRPGDSPDAKETKYTELIMKCLWKQAKTIQENLRSGVLRADQLLYEINLFFRATPPTEWKRRAAENVPLGEMPLRTVKTLLLELVNGLGDAIFGHLSLIEDPERSNVYPYLHHMLEACRKKEQQKQHQQGSPVPSDDQRSATSHSRTSSLSRPSSVASLKSNGMGTMLRSGSMASFPPGEEAVSQGISPSLGHDGQGEPMQVDEMGEKSLSDYEMNNLLKRIFDKIGTRDQTKQGIIELYEFQKKHPSAEAKVNTYLNQTGSYFPSYIRRGLNNLAAEDNEMRTTSSGMVTSPESPPSVPVSSSPVFGTPKHEHNRHSFDGYGRASAERPAHHPSPVGGSGGGGGGSGSASGSGGGSDDIKERLLRLQQTFGYRNEGGGDASKATGESNHGRLQESNTAFPHATFASQRASMISSGQTETAYIAGETDRAQSVSALKEKLARINKS